MGGVEGVIDPIGVQQQQQVLDRVGHFLSLAELHYRARIKPIPVLFDLSGSTAGMFRYQGRRCELRFNPWIFAKYFEENLRDTVPHEAAHYVVHRVYGRRGIKPHGPQWREVMAHYGADPGVTFNLDLEGIPQRRQRTHVYRCDCQLHELSTTRHNRVQRRRGHYQCRVCNGLLQYSPDQSTAQCKTIES